MKPIYVRFPSGHIKIDVAQSIQNLQAKHSHKGTSAQKPNNLKKDNEIILVQNTEMLGPSCVNLVSPVNSSDSESDDEELCCVCNKRWPPSLSKTTVQFVKWAKCDNCSHWTHINACVKMYVTKCTQFLCPHCIEE